MTTILDGKKTSKKIRKDIKKEINKINYKRPPRLVTILVGNDKPSEIYVKNKQKACEAVGIEFKLEKYENTITEKELLGIIQKYNIKDIDGILVQLPLPEHIDEKKVMELINPNKDVDGFHYVNMGKMVLGLNTVKPATPYGIITLLKEYGIDWKGKDIVVVGRGKNVGLPLSILLGNDDMGTVTTCHINTDNIKEKTLSADIIISAVGKPNLITEDMVKEGAIIVDVGINRIPDDTKKKGYKLVGDVDYVNVKKKSSYITPVPGGVGPMTIAGLLLNTMESYKSKIND